MIPFIRIYAVPLVIEVIFLLSITMKILAQAEPPQRGDRYLPGELFKAKCYVASSNGYLCNVLISPENNNCGMGKGTSTYAYPAPDKKDQNDYRVTFTIPAIPRCPTVDRLSIKIGEYQDPSYPCSGYIPTSGSFLNYIPIVPFDSMTMTYPANPSSIIEMRQDTFFYWFVTHKAQEFQFQLSTNKNFISSIKGDGILANGLIVDTILTQDFVTLPLYKLLKKNSQYYWRIRPKKNNQWLEWCAYTQFTARSTIQTDIYDEQTTGKLLSYVENNVLTLTDAAYNTNKDRLIISLVSLHGTITELPLTSFSFNDSDIVINIESLPMGWYTLVLTNNTNTRVATFIKQ